MLASLSLSLPPSLSLSLRSWSPVVRRPRTSATGQAFVTFSFGLFCRALSCPVQCHPPQWRQHPRPLRPARPFLSCLPHLRSLHPLAWFGPAPLCAEGFATPAPAPPPSLSGSPPSALSLLPSAAAGDHGPSSSSSPWSFVAARVNTVLPPASSVPLSGPSRWHGGALSHAYRPRVPGPPAGRPCPTLFFSLRGARACLSLPCSGPCAFGCLPHPLCPFPAPPRWSRNPLIRLWLFTTLRSCGFRALRPPLW